ncbi:MAG TPA: TonB-dependent receptor [Candidatus Elarobacter sp.]|nr:TonB-dependent receptor [Candidatus Elarobacter sp.]
MVALVLAFGIVLVPEVAAAGTTGVINGRATGAHDGKPVANASVTAASPSARYTGQTDASGFFAFTGVTPDTYTVSFAKPGFEPFAESGVTVAADQVAVVNVPLTASLKTIGSTVARANRGAYQPAQTQDTYTVTTTQLQTIQGKSGVTDEKSLLARMPGASLDVKGLPVLRGGRVDEEGYAFEGIEQTNAFNGLSQNVYRINSAVGQLQLTPGPGDASSGNTGTGVINLVAKRGTYPAFSSFDVEALAQPFGNQYSAEYGFATKDGRFSNYVMYLGARGGAQYGPFGTPAAQIGTTVFYSPARTFASDFVENFVYKFGRDNRQSLQVLYQNQQYDTTGTYGGTVLPYATSDPYVNFLTGAFLGLSPQQLRQLSTLYPLQQSASSTLGTRGAVATFTPSYTAKLQYTNSLNPSTFLSAKIYETYGVTTSDAPYREARLSTLGVYGAEGGRRDGVALDLSKQLGSKHLLQAGTKYEVNVPTLQFVDPQDALYAFGGIANANSSALYAFINPNDPNPALANCPIDPPSLAGTGRSYCGYLTAFLGANPGQVPPIQQGSHAIRQDYAAYVSDTFAPNDRLKIALGLRLDGAHYQLPSTAGCDSLAADTCQYAQTGSVNGHPVVDVPNSARNPLIPQPRLAAAYRFSGNDAVRASYGRSVEFVPIKLVDQADTPAYYARYANIPSYDAFGAMAAGVPPGQPFPARTCGITADRLCTSFADQLHWTDQMVASGIPIVPAKPETFTNYDFSYQHLFPHNVGLRVTPFYRRGYDAIALVAQVRLNPVTGQPFTNPATGAPQYGVTATTNLGRDSTTGIELALSRETQFGLSAQISATYINEFSNVVPTSPGEDFEPQIPVPSIVLGNMYRVGFISPFTATAALSYRTRSGWRVNPVLTYTRGFPLGVGNLVAGQVNGVFTNLPNTNATGNFSVRGVGGSPAYVDPQNPGTLYKPNVDATRGLPEGASPGGFLSSPSVNADLSVEYSPRPGKSTFGVIVTNLLSRTANSASYFLNDRYQPVATGISGPQTGYSAFPVTFPNHGVGQYTLVEHGNQPYLVLNNQPPAAVRFYYQVKM